MVYLVAQYNVPFDQAIGHLDQKIEMVYLWDNKMFHLTKSLAILIRDDIFCPIWLKVPFDW